jgi:hypothetical protein
MDDLAIIWFVVLLKVQKKVAIWSFFVSGPQGKQLALKHEIKGSFTAPPDPGSVQAFKRTKSLQEHKCTAVLLFA